ncbi:MBL fold metallo-hydrolase [Pelotomaculum propionicicum]|uniref:MBL fold metallo-hydrolase n=1 Tax=Pelotomaculum propionicicum TaxID=258475 RepID=UPI003B78D558
MPLPGNPLKALNSYLIEGPERSLLIDTGFNQEECRTALFDGLKSLGASLDQTDIFITHLHADHCGLVSAVATDKNVVYCSEVDARRINWGLSPEYWPENLSFVASYGFPLREFGAALLKHPGQKYSPDTEHDFSIVREGDILEVGDYRFTIVETPGHTPGHICLYEPDKKMLISGDHILGNISPNITMFYKGLPDPLGQYLRSLDKIDRMEIGLVLPGHRQVIGDVHKRIAELKHHYENRLNEVLTVLGDEIMSAYQVAAGITWDLSYTSWEQFPLEQMWFATGEAISHLEHLRQQDKVRRLECTGNYLFERVK